MVVHVIFVILPFHIIVACVVSYSCSYVCSHYSRNSVDTVEVLVDSLSGWVAALAGRRRVGGRAKRIQNDTYLRPSHTKCSVARL